MKLRLRWAVALMFVNTAAIESTGCMLLQNKVTVGETRVGQGKLYQSDNPTYDEFFDGVHDVQKQTIDAVDQEAKARDPLERALGTRNSTPERLVELTKQRVKGGREGPPVHVVVTGLEAEKEDERPKNVVVSVTVPDEAAIATSQRDLVKALEESAKSEAQIVDKFGPVSARARRLLAREEQLAKSANADFTTTSRRQEVLNELGASKLILAAVADRATKVSGNARSFLKGMAEALSGSADAAAATASKDEKDAGGKGAASPTKNGASPPKPAKPPASPNPPPKPKTEPPARPHAEPPPHHEAPAQPPAAKPAPPSKPPSEEFNP